jgi:hypothetical protein
MLSTLLFAGLALAQSVDPVFDIPAILKPPLAGRVLKASEKDGIITEEVMFHSERDGDKSVEIFALFSYPKEGRKLPAFIWNQGGLARATPYFTELGAKRGYAALCIDFPITSYRSTGGYSINAGVELPSDPRQAPIYHGAVALLRAVSYLQSRPEVDGERIGIAGSSWGGFYTTMQVGLDARLKVGSSMFGCGALELGNNWWDGQGKDPKRTPEFRRRWAETLDPARRLSRSRTPLACFTGTNDVFYWLPSVMETLRRSQGDTHLGLLPNWNHALTPEIDEQVFTFLDIHLKEAEKFLEVTPLTVDEERRATWRFAGKRTFARAELMVSFGEEGCWSSRYWMTLPATAADGTCRATVPRGKLPAYVIGTVIDKDGFRSSTGMVVVPGDKNATTFVPAYDGCSEWGGMNPGQVRFLQLHGLPALPMDGQGRPRLPEAKTVTLGPILFTPGVKHQLRLRLHGDAAQTVPLALVGVFDRTNVRESLKLERAAGDKEWRVAHDFTPPRTSTGRLALEIRGQAGNVTWFDGVQFVPVE